MAWGKVSSVRILAAFSWMWYMLPKFVTVNLRELYVVTFVHSCRACITLSIVYCCVAVVAMLTCIAMQSAAMQRNPNHPKTPHMGLLQVLQCNP